MSAVKLIPASGGGSVSLAPPNSTSGADITVTMPTASQGLGKILQVVQAVKDDTTSSTTDSFVDISGLSASITPSSSSSKILLSYSVYVSHANATVSFINPVRGSTTIAQPSDTSTTSKGTTTIYTWGSGYMMFNHNYTFLDSPNTTSATTYKLQYRAYGGVVYINRYANANNYYGQSSLTLMEVAA